MGTETPVLALSHLVVTLYTVKLNNPLMGTETIYLNKARCFSASGKC